MTFKNNLKFISWTITFLLIQVILFAIFLIVGYSKLEVFNLSELVIPLSIISGIIFIFTIPGLLLHYKYYSQDKGKSLSFRPTYLEITDITGSNKVYFKDIAKVEKHFVSYNRRNPWSGYGYIKIFVNDNKVFSYNCLTHDYLSSAVLFESKKVIVEEYDELFPW